jgi:electron transfer flavoprotein alpha subunit
MELGEDGRLLRSDVALELNAYCRRAVSQGVALARATGGSTTVFTLGPESARDVLREAIGWGADRGILVTDARFAGSDTVATSIALAAALEQQGPFDLVLVGRNSLDADTGQVGPGVAELLGWAFLPSVKALTLSEGVVTALCEEDDGESERVGVLPLVVATAERLIEPCKVDAADWPAADDPRITVVGADDIGPGPWGAAASPTTVGEVRIHDPKRAQVVFDGPPSEVVELAASLLADRGAFEVPDDDRSHGADLHRPREGAVHRIGVVIEPGRAAIARELLGEANVLAGEIDGSVVAITLAGFEPEVLSTWGADAIELLDGPDLRERDVAGAVAALAAEEDLWALLLPSTAWGREVAGRISARLHLGLTGDALEFGLESAGGPPALVAWKSALGGQLLVAIRSSTHPQMATVRPGALALRTPRPASPLVVRTTSVTPIGGMTISSTRRNDDVEELERATHVVGVGGGVPPSEYDSIEAFAKSIGATVAATRKVTDNGWMPRARQIGITGRSLRPHLYVAIGISGKFNHAVGVRSADTIFAINSDPAAPIFGFCDVGIVGDWREVLPLLSDAISSRL